MLLPLGSEPRHWLSSDFHVLHATTELIPLSAGNLSPLDPYVIMLYWFLDSKFFLRINRAWLHKDLKGWDFQQIGELAQW